MDRVDSIEFLRTMQSLGLVPVEGFGIALLDHAKSAKLALVAIPIALVVTVFGGQLASRDRVYHLDPGDDLDRKWQPRLPASLRLRFVRHIKAGRGAVLDQY